MYKIIIISILLSISIISFAQTKNANAAEMQKLLTAYPTTLSKIDGNNIVFKDGTKMTFEDGKTPVSYSQLMDDADLHDQMKTPYNRKDYSAPKHNHDPGRVRHEAFFKKMYGNNATEVKANLTTIQWFGTALQVTTINGVDKKLTAVRDELTAKPELKKYLEKPGGTFNWRVIAGTKRLSMHSFGISIDINTKFTNYWQWAHKGAKEGEANLPYKNQIPKEIVEIFEKHGFIWGGRWYHYDTMHFEYRPELL